MVGNGQMGGRMDQQLDGKKKQSTRINFHLTYKLKKTEYFIDLKGTGQSLTMKTSFQIILIYISLMF